MAGSPILFYLKVQLAQRTQQLPPWEVDLLSEMCPVVCVLEKRGSGGGGKSSNCLELLCIII